MSQVPDIRSLYQKKFLPSAVINNNSLPSQLVHSSNHKLRLYSQRVGNIQSRSNIKYVKISIKPNYNQSVQLLPADTFPRKNSRHSKWRQNISTTQSMHLPGRNNQLVRQMMKITHQEMGELQTSVGGEKKLINMFQTFFNKRSQTKQKNRQEAKNINFVPMSPHHEYSRHRLPRQTYNKRKQRKKYIQSAFQDKQLAPWNIADGQFP